MAARHQKIIPTSAEMQTIRTAQMSLGQINTFRAASLLWRSGRSPLDETIANISRMINVDKIATARLAGVTSPTSQLASLILGSTPQIRALDAISKTWASQHSSFGSQIGQIISAQLSVATVFNDLTYQQPLRGLFDSVTRYSLVQARLAELSIDRPGSDLLRGLTTRSGRRYDSYLNGLPAKPIARRATVARLAGDTLSGLLVTESLTAESLDTDDRGELTEQVTTLVLEPWQSGPQEARNELFAVLDRLEAGNADWLKAAWEDIVRDGPKAASKIANCAVECIDRSLRAAAPDDAVHTWLATVAAKATYLDKGRPTRAGRVSYIMRDRSNRDTALAEAQVESLIRLIQAVHKDFQSVKHGEAATVAAMRGWILATESALCQLFLPASHRDPTTQQPTIQRAL